MTTTSDVDIARLLDPEIAAVLAAMPLGLDQLNRDTLAAVREAMRTRTPCGGGSSPTRTR